MIFYKRFNKIFQNFPLPPLKEMKNLLIVESPTKVKSIQKFLGKDFKVVASVGHVRDLVATGKKGIDVTNGYQPVWKVTKEKRISWLI